MPISHQHPEDVYVTVDEVIMMLRKISAEGRGNYLVACAEYWAVRKDSVPEAFDGYGYVDLGGYH